MKTCAVVSSPEVQDPAYGLFSGTFEEKMQKASTLGLEGVELLIQDIHGFDHQFVNTTASSYGIKIPALVTGGMCKLQGLTLLSPYPEIEEKAWDQLMGFLEFAGCHGAVVDIGLLRGNMRPMPDPQAAKLRMLEKFRAAAEYAAHTGARVTLEPINRYEIDQIHSAEDGLRWVKEVDHPCFGLMLDTFHMNIEDASIEQSVKTAGHLLWHVHVADNNRLFPGQGHFDFTTFFKSLEDIHFQGYSSAEISAIPNPDQAALEAINFLKRYKP